MELRLSKLGFEPKCVYEVIVTTLNEDKTLNAAPMGVLLGGDDILIMQPYIATRTYHNISRTREAVVNITDDITLFFTTIFEKEKVRELPVLKAKHVSVPILADSKAYVECMVEGEPVVYDGRAKVTLRALECGLLSQNSRPICRAFNVILESIIHFTRVKYLVEKGDINGVMKLLELITFYKDLVKRVCGGTRYEEMMNRIYEEAYMSAKGIKGTLSMFP
ncbi:MAG: DUF447 family protein [Candidatus Jordarchaeales archaeon]